MPLQSNPIPGESLGLCDVDDLLLVSVTLASLSLLAFQLGVVHRQYPGSWPGGRTLKMLMWCSSVDSPEEPLSIQSFIKQ